MRFNEPVRAVGYRVRCLLRAQWRSTLAATVVVAVVTGVVLALAAGAARTSSAPDRYTAARGGGFDGTVQQERGRPRTAEVAALPGVESVDAVTFVFGGLARRDGASAPDAIVFAGSHRAIGTRLATGREADPSVPGEFVATRTFAEAWGVALGDRFTLRTLSQEQADRAGFEAFATEGPQGPSLDAVLVGTVDGPAELEEPTPLAVVPPSLLDRGAGAAVTIMSLQMRPGTSLDDVRAQLDELPDGETLSLERAEFISPFVRTAVQAQGQGYWLLAAVAAVTAIVVLGQLITRSVRLPTEEANRLEALGFKKTQVLGESAGRAAVPIVGGAVLAVVVSASLSPLFPTGFVRRIEPHPGPRVDGAVLAAGTVAAVMALILWTVAALALGRRRREPERPAELVEWVAVRCPTAALATGFRFAFTRSRRDRGSIRGTVTGMLAITVLLVGTVVFGSSLARLVSDGHRYGDNHDLWVGTGGETVPEEQIESLVADDDVAALTVYGTGRARLGPMTLGVAAMDPVKGALAPTIVSGRLPSGDDEIALGRLAAHDLGAGVGSELTVQADAGGRSFRVTGLAVVPAVEGLEGVGQDAVITMGALRRIDPEATPVAAGLTLREGAPAGTAERLGLGPSSRPVVITNLARVRAIPFLLAGLVGALAVLTVVHVMATSVYHRRRDVALLRSLGADGGWITRAVHWQATSFALLPLALGAPLGLIAGRLVFRMFADSVGAVSSASFPYVVLIVVMAGFVALGNAVAAVPARRARRLAPAPLLTSE